MRRYRYECLYLLTPDFRYGTGGLACCPFTPADCCQWHLSRPQLCISERESEKGSEWERRREGSYSVYVAREVLGGLFWSAREIWLHGHTCKCFCTCTDIRVNEDKCSYKLNIDQNMYVHVYIYIHTEI